MKPNMTFLATRKYDYLYDGNTGYILRIHPLAKTILRAHSEATLLELYDRLQEQQTKSEIDLAWQEIAAAKERGLLVDQPEELFLDVLLKQVPFTLNHSLHGICLSVTQQCNLQCEYCAYSGIYGQQNRQHSNEHMSFETAKKAIDYTIARSTSWDEYHVSFYGGEPLVRFDFIKQCIEYVKTQYPGKKMDFNITTNGTLLTKEKLSYLVQNSVRLYVSIDGPEEYHDEYRKYVNGKGSFIHIKQNLLQIKELYPEYYHQKVNFGITLSPYRSLERIEEFIANDEIFYENGFIRISSVSGGYEIDIYEEKRTEEIIRESHIESTFLDLRYLISKTRGDSDYMHKTRVGEKFCETIDVSERRKILPSKKVIPSGPCIPGHKLFVTTRGDYVICEKTNETGCLKLGNVDDGLDVERAQAILQEFFKLTEKECLECWAYLSCPICPAQIEKDGVMSRTEKLNQCKAVRSRLTYEMTLYLAILEKIQLLLERFEVRI